jgi:transportin-3
VGLEVKIFAAQTLRSKIKYDFHQLSEETALSLRNALLELLVQYSAGPRAIMIQICISIATLGLQRRSWTSVIPDVVDASGNALEALLQFLVVLPEEANDARRMILTDAELNDRIAALLTNNADEVLQLLMEYSESPCMVS